MTIDTCAVCNLVLGEVDAVRCRYCSTGFHAVKCKGLNRTTFKSLAEINNICFICDDCLMDNTPHSTKEIMSVLNKHSELLNVILEKMNISNNQSVPLNQLSNVLSEPPSTIAMDVPPSQVQIIDAIPTAAGPNAVSDTNIDRAPSSSNSSTSITNDKASSDGLDHGPKPKRAPGSNSNFRRNAEQSARSDTPHKIIIGTSDNETFCAAERRQWIYIGGCSPATTTSDINDYVVNVLNISDVKCFPLTKNDDTCSFKIGVKESLIEGLLHPNLWPKKTLIKEFLPRKPRFSGRANFRQDMAAQQEQIK